jgi:hypothetical protein
MPRENEREKPLPAPDTSTVEQPRLRQVIVAQVFTATLMELSTARDQGAHGVP